MIKLDLKNFKYKSSDGKTTTLQHAKDGHTITLAHASLAPASRDQLQALSKASEQAETPLQHDEMKHKMANGGEIKDAPQGQDSRPDKGWGAIIVKEKAEGGNVEQPEPKKEEPPKSSSSSKEPQPHRPPKSNTKYEDRPSKEHGGIKHKLADGGDVEADHEHEGSRFCMHCGGKMYAGGGKVAEDGSDDQAPEVPEALAPNEEQVDDPSDVGPERMAPSLDKVMQDPIDAAAQTPLPQKSAFDDNKVRYNQALASSGRAVSAADMFGPNGEAPQNPVDPNLWAQAKGITTGEGRVDQAQGQRQATQAYQEQMSAHDKAVKQNQVNKELGLPPVADPGVPQVHAPGQQQQAPPPGQQQPPVAPMDPNSPAAGTAKAKGAAPGVNDPLGMSDHAFHQAQAALTQQGQIQGKIAEQNFQSINQGVDSLQKLHDTTAEKLDGVNQELMDVIHDIRNQHIDPEQYWTGVKDPSTGKMVGGHSKIMAAIGMILGGFNPNGQNGAADMLKFNIENNVRAQTADLNSKHNLVSAYLNQMGNLRDAQNMARLTLSEITKLKIDQAAAQNGSAMAQTQAQLAKANLEMEYAPKRQQIAMSQAMLSMMSNGGQGMNDPRIMQFLRFTGHKDIADDLQSRIAPGNLGVSPYKPIEKQDADRMESYQNVLRSLNEALNFKRTHPVASWTIPDRHTATTLLQNTTDQIRRAQDMGVLKPAEIGFMKSMTGGSPAGFFAAIDSQPQLRELLRLKHNEFGTLLGKYNLQMPKDINPNGFYEGQIVKNRQTGARMIYKNNNWYPIISKTPGTRPE